MNQFKYHVSFEGVETTGKTFQLNRIASRLLHHGKTYVMAPEFPADPSVRTEIDAALRASIFIGQGFSKGPIPAYFFMLYAAALKMAALNGNADLLLEDRGLDSLALYQGLFAAHSFDASPVDLVCSLERLYAGLGLRIPDLTILLVSPMSVVKKRFAEREDRSLSANECTYIERLQNAYLMVARHSNRYCTIDAAKAASEVEDDILARIMTLIRGGQ